MEDSQQEEHFTCWTCKVKFTDVAIFRNHYRTEWHRYNMHATVSGLPPITFEKFLKKEEIYRESTVNQTEKKQVCEVCRKRFSSQKQYENHVVSKAHKKKLEQEDKTIDFEKSKKSTNIKDISNKNKESFYRKVEEFETDSDVESLDSDEWIENSKYHMYENNCLFCDYRSKTLKCSMKHMMKSHSFFIPYIEYCVDLSGLLDYLEQKICFDFKCIWCNDSGRKMQSEEAVKMHMIDKGHCTMLFEGETLLEYSPFYDYSAIYPDAKNPGEEPDLSEILDDEVYMLTFPSGKSIVHRALAFYYKQNLSLKTTVTIRKYNYWLHKHMKQISFGNVEKKLEVARKTARDVQKYQRIQAKYSTQLQFKQNKLQKHFRQQVGFF